MFKEYIEKQIETLSEEDNQVSYDRIRDYNEILERGIFRTFDGVKTLRVFKAGDVVLIAIGLAV